MGSLGRSTTTVRSVPAASEPVVQGAYEYSLTVHLIDADDLPAAGSAFWVGPEMHPLNRADTDDGGVKELRWRAHAPSMAVVYGAPNAIIGDRLRRIELTAGQPARVAVRSRRSAMCSARPGSCAPSSLIELSRA